MKTMTSREFNQRTHEAQKAAREAPLLITQRGKPDLVIMSYQEYEKYEKKPEKPELSFLESWMELAKEQPDVSDIELEIPARRPYQRKPVEFD